MLRIIIVALAMAGCSERQITLQGIRPPSSLPFATTVSSDMAYESTKTSTGEAHYFYTKFGRRPATDEYLLIFIFPAGTTREQAIPIAREFRNRARPTETLSTMDLKMHGDRYYFIGEQYKKKNAEKFRPRSKFIQDSWQWLDATSQPPRE